jgi:hypothetical protein
MEVFYDEEFKIIHGDIDVDGYRVSGFGGRSDQH